MTTSYDHNSHYYDHNTQFSEVSPLSANGRFGRLAYLGWNFLLGLLSFLTLLIAVLALGALGLVTQTDFLLAHDSLIYMLVTGLCLIFFISIMYFSIVFGVRRLHDLNLTGWLWLLYLVPVIGWFFAIYVLLAPGSKGANDYGQPYQTKTWEKVCAICSFAIIPIIAITAAIAIPSYQNYVEKTRQQHILMTQAQQEIQAGETELLQLEQELRVTQQNLAQESSAVQASY